MTVLDRSASNIYIILYDRKYATADATSCDNPVQKYT